MLLLIYKLFKQGLLIVKLESALLTFYGRHHELIYLNGVSLTRGGRQYGSYVIRSYKSEFTPFLVAACVALFKVCYGPLFVFLWIYGFASITSRYLLTLLVTHNFTTKHWLLSLTSHRFIMLIDGSKTCRKWSI